MVAPLRGENTEALGGGGQLAEGHVAVGIIRRQDTGPSLLCWPWVGMVVVMGQQAGVLEGIRPLGGAAERPGGRLAHRLVPGGGGAV